MMENSGPTSGSSSDRPKRSAGISEALRMMQLDDYEIKPTEIEIITNLDGSPCLLGRGAFGEVIILLLAATDVWGQISANVAILACMLACTAVPGRSMQSCPHLLSLSKAVACTFRRLLWQMQL